MDGDDFARCGQQMLDYMRDYHKSLEERDVLPSVKPGFLRELIPDHAPEKAEKFDELLKDVEKIIMPGVGGLAEE